MNIIIKKICVRCEVPQSVANFNKSNTSKDGYKSYCRQCDKEKNHERYNQKKDLIIKNIKTWQDKNQDKVSEYKKNFYEKNKLEGNGQ